MSGERGRNRTFNLLIKSQLLCQLSYAPGLLRQCLPPANGGFLHYIAWLAAAHAPSIRSRRARVFIVPPRLLSNGADFPEMRSGSINAPDNSAPDKSAPAQSSRPGAV